MDSAGLKYGLVAGSYGRGNPPFSSLNCWEFLVQLSECYLLKKECTHGVSHTQYMKDAGGWGRCLGSQEGRNKLHGSLPKQKKPQWRSCQPGEHLFTPQPETRSWRLKRQFNFIPLRKTS